MAIVNRQVVRRRQGQEEVGVESLGHHFRRDPMSKMHQLIAGEHQLLLGGEFRHRELAPVQAVAIGLQRPQALSVHQIV